MIGSLSRSWLVKLPRSPTVDGILTKYLEYRVKKDNKISDSCAEVTKGLRCYFDKALPAMLLYKKEQKQYKEEIKGDVSPSTVYGAEHLLRLFGETTRATFFCEHGRRCTQQTAAEITGHSQVSAEEPSPFLPFCVRRRFQRRRWGKRQVEANVGICMSDVPSTARFVLRSSHLIVWLLLGYGCFVGCDP
uniref:MRG domain-containing protein n=1 Tax=Aegilops tauschii subsp. strangulata TaxID=200361 RepID=A0A453ACR1_AEGTS